MKLSHFFIDRPIFSTVISILIIILGAIAYFTLPVTQYPEIAPPTIEVRASYPGASAEIVARTVATPLEQEINGVEDMIYMISQSTNDGNVNIRITFKLGTDLDEAQVLVQNRVAIGEARLPEEVRRIGVNTQKASPDLMMVVHMYSPDDTYDQTYIANYATLQVTDVLNRIKGVGAVRLFGASEYSMRVWLDPDRIASLDLTAGEILQALRNQNIQVASGTLNQPPVDQQLAFEVNIQTQGRFEEPEEFENIIVKSSGGRIVRIKDIGRVELGAQSYATLGYLDDKAAVAMPIFQRPGTNAIETSEQIRAAMKRLAKDFPKGLEYEIIYDPTEYVRESIHEVIRTIFEASFLVVLVIIVFLQSLRASFIPISAIPVSLVGTFAVMQAFGFSLNTLTLFGLVLAIGIVVDDAIVVVENIERNLDQGMNPKEAARKSMDEVGGAIIATTLVLVAVFIPTMFMEGITGQFYRQFGITITVATIMSSICALTFSPSMAALVLESKEQREKKKNGSFLLRPIRAFFALFDRGLNYFTPKYASWIGKLIRKAVFVVIFYVVFLVFTGFQFNRVPTGFIPAQDKGYFIVAIQLPPGSSLSRTNAVVQEATEKLLSIDGVINTAGFAGFDGASFTNASNGGAIFPVLEDFDTRKAKGLTFDSIFNEMNQKMASIDEAFVVVVPPPPVNGMGNAGGFRMMVQDRRGRGLKALKDATFEMMFAASQEPGVQNVFTFFNTDSPQLYFDIDRQRAERLGVPVSEIFQAMEVYLGSTFVNDFNYLGRTFRVTAQADAPYRLTSDDVVRIKVRNNDGEMVPLGSIGTFSDISGANRVARYNLYPAAALIGNTAPGYSSGEALNIMERLADRVLPNGFSFEWTELAYQEKQIENTAIITFSLAILFVFLLLAAQYESWILPLSIIMIVPMCLLPAISGVVLRGQDNNVLTQIGLVVLIALASKNAILIVEFAKQLEDRGKNRWEAAVEASRLRLRPILMTAFSFILGVLPLVFATGAGSEMRRVLGTTVFSGMLGVTIFGLFLTPVFYVLCRKLSESFKIK